VARGSYRIEAHREPEGTCILLEVSLQSKEILRKFEFHVRMRELVGRLRMLAVHFVCYVPSFIFKLLELDGVKLLMHCSLHLFMS
jgi:hypothetical protein